MGRPGSHSTEPLKLLSFACYAFLVPQVRLRSLIKVIDDGWYTLIRDIRSTGLKQLAAALTAQARDIDRAQALAAGFDAHISKPVEARTLAQAVATLIGGARVTIT